MPPRQFQNFDYEDYIIIRQGVQFLEVSDACKFHGYDIECIWDDKTGILFHRNESLPFTLDQLVLQASIYKKYNKKLYILSGIDEDGYRHFGIPPFFMRVNFSGDYEDLPLVYIRWISYTEIIG